MFPVWHPRLDARYRVSVKQVGDIDEHAEAVNVI
jgi:hypothetical protein